MSIIRSDATLKNLLFSEEPLPPRKALPDFAAIKNELKRKGVTLQLLWEEYRAANPDGSVVRIACNDG